MSDSNSNSNNTTFTKTFGDSKDTEQSLKYVQHRVVHGGITSDHIADFLKKYGEIQHEFSKKIDRLIRHAHPSSADLGTFEDSWTSFLQVVATQGLEAYDLSEKIIGDKLESQVRNKRGRKETSEILSALHADSKTLSAHSYHSKAVSAMDKLQTIEEDRLDKLQNAISQVSTQLGTKSQKIQDLTAKLNENLVQFGPKTDVESYLAQVVAGDVQFPDLSPANSAGYHVDAPNRYASPTLPGDGGHSIRPQASPFTLNNESRESRLKKFFTKST